MKHPASCLVAFLAALSAVPAAAQAPEWQTQPRDWSQALRDDATALHDAVIDSHPGVYDNLNPGFRAQVDQGLTTALQRAETTHDAGGWWWALRAYVASFDDGHLQLGTSGSGGFPVRWPGFLTGYRGDDAVVAVVEDGRTDTPPVGARLLDCDGVDAEALGAQRIGQFRGRWFLESQRFAFGDWLFMNASNPWTSEMKSCRFQIEGAARAYDLTWAPIADEPLVRYRTAVTGARGYDFGTRRLDDGGWWLSMPSFDGAPEGEAAKALTAMLAEAETNQTALRAAPYVVLDLRGNGGGSSHWSDKLALTLWGMDWLSQHSTPPIEAIEWRASDGNIAGIQAFADELKASGAGDDDERVAWARSAIDGMKAAQAAGRPYFRDANTAEPDAAPATAAVDPVKGRVYVITDAGCGSACLDAVDLWKAAGAVQVGRETSADTVYMEIREAPLASGLARLWMPMKVWRGRARGNNEPQRPAHVFDGDMGDTAALEAWVRDLAARPAR